MNGEALPERTRTDLAAAERNELAKEMASALARYQRWHGEALKRSANAPLITDEGGANGYRDRVLREAPDTPADQVSWSDLATLTAYAPELADDTWERVKSEARDEMDTGWRALHVVEPDGVTHTPWDRARFLVVRDSLREEWTPRPGTESALVDMLAQIQTTWEDWLARHVERMTYSGRSPRGEPGLYASEVEVLEQTAAMADRWQRAYLRTVRALRDLRRHMPAVVIQNAAQVNVAERQVNVSQ